MFVYFVELKMATSVSPQSHSMDAQSIISPQSSTSDFESSFSDDTLSEEEEVACESRVSV